MYGKNDGGYIAGGYGLKYGFMLYGFANAFIAGFILDTKLLIIDILVNLSKNPPSESDCSKMNRRVSIYIK